MSRSIARRPLAALAALLLPLGALTVAVAPASSAAPITAPQFGVVSAVGGSWYNTLTYTAPAATTITMSAPNANYYPTCAPAMTQDNATVPPFPAGTCSGNWWDGVGDYTTAYTPSSVKTTGGVSLTYRSSKCTSSPGAGTPASPTSVSCPPDPNDPPIDTITFTFSREVTNATLSVGNLAGGNSSNSLQAILKNSSGQTLRKLSSIGNIEVANGDTIQAIEAAGKDLPVGGDPLNIAPQGSRTYYGAGAGSFLVIGTYTEVTFEVRLQWNNLSSGSGSDIPEGIAFQWTLPTVEVADDAVSTAFGTAKSGNAATNDPTSGLAYEVLGDPSHGSVTMNADGTYTYTPAAGFTGIDTFTYLACDPADSSNCATATVTVAVGPKATADSKGTPINTPIDATAADNDTYVTGATFKATSQPAHGTVTMNSDGTYTYTPDKDYSGADSFTYEVCNPGTPKACATATVSLQVGPKATDDKESTSVDTAVKASVTANDLYARGATFTSTSTPAHGTVVMKKDGTYTYTPDPGYAGADTFDYKVCNPGTPKLCDTATVTITIKASPGPGPDPKPERLPLDVDARAAGKRLPRAGESIVIVAASTNGKGNVVTKVSCKPNLLGRGDVRYCTYVVGKDGSVTVTTLGIRNVAVTVTQVALPKNGTTPRKSKKFTRTWLVK